MPAASSSQTRALGLFALAALSFGLMAFATKLATAELSGSQVAFLRFATMLLPLALPRIARRAVTFERLDLLVYRGVFGGVAVLLWFVSIAHVPVGLATLLNHSSPVWSALFASLFLGERLTARRLLPLAAALGGLALVVSAHLGGTGGRGSGIWIGAGFASAVLAGAAVTAIRAARRSEGSWAIYGSFTLCGLAATAPFGLGSWRMPSAREWGLLAVIGLASIVAQLLMTHAYRWVDNLRAGVFAPLTPIAALLLGWIVLGERLSPAGLAGTALALAGVVVTVAEAGRRRGGLAPPPPSG